MKKLKICALLIAVILIAASCAAPTQSAEEITVKVEFDTSAVDYSGTLTDKVLEVTVWEGSSIFEATSTALENEGIDFDYDNSASVFVTGIGDLTMGDFAKTDGWMYSVNGVDIWEPCEDYKLNDGDTVTWKFLIW